MNTPDRDDEGTVRRLLDDAGGLLDPSPPPVGAIRARARQRRRHRHRATVLGIASPLVAAAAAAVVVTTVPRTPAVLPAGPASSATPQPTPASPTAAPPSPTATSPATSSSASGAPFTPPPANRLAKPWHTTLIKDSPSVSQLLTAGGWIYAAGPSTSGTVVYRFDPTSGTATRTPLTAMPVASGTSLWTLTQIGDSDRYRLRNYDSHTLEPGPTNVVSMPNSTNAGLATAAGGGGVYVYGDHTITVINPATGDATHTVPINAGKISDVAVAPDGSAVYLVTTSAGKNRLERLDPRTWTVAWKVSVNGSNGAKLVASAGGVWSVSGAGMNSWTLTFMPGNGNRAHVRVYDAGGSGMVARPDASGRTVWIGGANGKLSCADPSTGAVRAKAQFPNPGYPTAVHDIVTVSGQTYAIYQGPQTSTLATLAPPEACR